MNAKTLIASILIAVGIMAFLYMGITYKARETAFELGLGPLDVTTERSRTPPIPPIVGVVALAGGLMLLFARNSKLLVPVVARKESR